MALPAHRIGDATSGHGPWPPRLAVEGSQDVIINGRGAVRAIKDQYPIHCLVPPVVACHQLAVAVGSSTVIINGFPATRTGDQIQCGEFVVIGSEDVLIG